MAVSMKDMERIVIESKNKEEWRAVPLNCLVGAEIEVHGGVEIEMQPSSRP
jgi:hypothetical protein